MDSFNIYDWKSLPVYNGLSIKYFLFTSYSIKHLENEKKYLVNADIHVCFETRASCVHEFTVLRDALFEKEDCDWRIGFVDPGIMDRWLDDLQFYSLFNSISVISGPWEDDNERLCAVEPCLQSESKVGLLAQQASA